MMPILALLAIASPVPAHADEDYREILRRRPASLVEISGLKTRYHEANCTKSTVENSFAGRRSTLDGDGNLLAASDAAGCTQGFNALGVEVFSDGDAKVLLAYVQGRGFRIGASTFGSATLVPGSSRVIDAKCSLSKKTSFGLFHTVYVDCKLKAPDQGTITYTLDTNSGLDLAKIPNRPNPAEPAAPARLAAVPAAVEPSDPSPVPATNTTAQ